MSLNRNRCLTLGHLKRTLYALRCAATVRCRDELENRWKARCPWPGPEEDRDAAFALLSGLLESWEDGVLIVILPDCWPVARRFEVEWPEAPGLFTPDEPPSLPRAVRINASGESIDDDSEAPEGKPPKASLDCAGDIRKVLGSVGRRMTGRELVDHFGEAQDWSKSTVEATCAWLVDEGELTSGRDERGKGYGLSEWAATS